MLAVYIYKTFDIYVVCIDYLVKERDAISCLQFLVYTLIAFTPPMFYCRINFFALS